jgi:hypothetical protein
LDYEKKGGRYCVKCTASQADRGCITRSYRTPLNFPKIIVKKFKKSDTIKAKSEKFIRLTTINEGGKYEVRKD